MSMTESEATKLHIGIIGSGRKYPRSVGEYMDSIEELEQYRAIGTVEELRALKEKATAKKPITYDGTCRADCPVCGATVRGIGKPFGNYCSKCGTALDWSE